MNEKFPQMPVPDGPEEDRETLETAEAIPATYEDILAAAKNLKAHGVSDPFSTEDPRTVALWDAIEVLNFAYPVPSTGIESVERAEFAIKMSRLFIEAGYRGKEAIENALDQLHVEINLIESHSRNKEVLYHLYKATDELEELAAEGKKEKKIEAKIDAIIKQAEEQAALGTLEGIMEANRLIAIQNTARYKTYFGMNPEKLEYVTKLSDTFSKEFRKKWNEEHPAK